MSTPIDEICIRHIIKNELGYTDEEILADDNKAEAQRVGLSESIRKFKKNYEEMQKEVVEVIK